MAPFSGERGRECWLLEEVLGPPLEGELDRGFDSHCAVVLRPDRYVFGVVDDTWDLDRLLSELARKLALR